MQPQRTWRPGEEYWALCINATNGRYFAEHIGTVEGVYGAQVHLTNGSWRLVSEGLPFKSRGAAQQYISENPVDGYEVPPPRAAS
jgi:hypothetical protein